MSEGENATRCHQERRILRKENGHQGKLKEQRKKQAAKKQQQHCDKSLTALKWREVEKGKRNRIFQKMVSPDYCWGEIGTETDEVFFCSLKSVIV